ncbi:hypothetical protein ACMD2_05293 [Ananas comosus]|uniref:DUF7912 domain-containing protein n=1 Tax=Ananas comosus TaxID=4615 RepID=A0A199UM13_ANACO|nr:hypothetical protein ACMD2_05293 [Ananas comosus]
MDLVSNGVIQNRVFGCGWISSSNSFLNNGSSYRPGSVSLLRCLCPPPVCGNASLSCHAKKRERYAEPVAKPKDDDGDDDNVEEEKEEEEGGIEEEFIEDFDDEIIMDDTEDFEDDFESDDANLYVGDGGEGGGISLAGTWWDKEALAIAEDVSKSFGGDLKLYAFKTLANSVIKVRIEKLSSKYGSPSMNDIEAFSSAYQSRLDEAELGKRIPENISLEDRPMYVKYTTTDAATSSIQENDGVFKLISYDMELCQCIWGVADVKINRKQAGKGRPLSKKQREWRLQTPFEDLRLVRLYSDC